MKHILSFGISILSIIIGILVMLGGYIIYGKRGFLEGAPGWILGTLGAPTTFLYWIIYKIGLSRSLISQYVWASILYLLQYQLIAWFIYKKLIDITTKKGIICLIGIMIIIIISANIMWRVITGPTGH